ncbi:MAG: hypothetical protein FWH17_01505 [Oscillospiraceae bacterium]|nr:hypothetical protein [Oscillospiraceae bacterium]
MSTITSTDAIAKTDRIQYTQNSGVERVDAENPDGEEFSALLNQALKGLTQSAGMNAYTDMTGMSGTFLPTAANLAMPSVSNTLEQAMLTASSSGDNKDTMVALLMLMMMMQSSSGSGGGEMSMLMQMMTGLISQMQDQDSLRNSFMYSSGGEPFVLDLFDEQIFNKPIPEVTGTDKPDLPLEWWRPTTPTITGSPENRNPSLYSAVVNQFDVENSERYRPGREGNTYCNIFVWDVTRAMGAELPYYTEPSTGAPRYYPDTKGANCNGAIAMDNWLHKYGAEYGWQEVDAKTAQMLANQGHPVVTSAGDMGHVQVVVPSKDGNFDPIRGVTVAQAGSTRSIGNYKYISETYNANTLNTKISYFAHP